MTTVEEINIGGVWLHIEKFDCGGVKIVITAPDGRQCGCWRVQGCLDHRGEPWGDRELASLLDATGE